MSESRSRSAPRSRTAPQPKGRSVVTPRDLDVILTVFLQRAATRKQLQELGLFGSVSVANCRLRKLFDTRHLRRVFVSAGGCSSEAVYVTGRAAVPEIVAALGIEKSEVERLASQEAPFFLAHALAATDVRVAFERGCPPEFASFRWFSEPECRHEYSVRNPGGGFARRIMKPDGAARFALDGISHLVLIEVDRGHVSRPQFAKSLATYRDYLGRRLAEAAYGADRVSVLCVTTGGRRARSLRDVARATGVPVAFAEMEEVMGIGPYAAVWLPGDAEARLPLAEVLR